MNKKKIIIFSEYPEDFKELFFNNTSYNRVSELSIEFLASNDTSDITEYGLLIEDDPKHIIDFLLSIYQTEKPELWLICTTIPITHAILSSLFAAPLFVGLDFRLDRDSIEKTKELYDSLKQKWENLSIVGITNYEENKKDDETGILKAHLRTNSDSVYRKKAALYEVLPNIIRDKIAISKLQSDLNKVKTKSRELANKLEEYENLLPKESGKDYIVGNSLSMRKVYYDLKMIKGADNLRVLILGESGTGKELIAKAIHEDSPRKRESNEKYSEYSFIAVNCSTFSSDSNSAISELFGHVAGAYTDAKKDRDGIFKLANNGTVFLDEIGCLPLDVQTMLLRYMNDGKYNRLGESKVYHSNVRIICATNEDLDFKVKEGRFRKDFLARVAEWTIKLPSLNERNDDIPLLADYFIKNSDLLKDKFKNKNIKFQLDNKAIDLLKTFDFDSSNIRQLKSTIINAMVISKFNNILNNGVYLITEVHIKEGFEKAGGKYKYNALSNVSCLKSTDYSDVEKFLDKIEDIVVTHFLDKIKVTIEDILEFYLTSKGNRIKNRNSFSQQEMTPRAAIIEKLIKEEPSQWPNAIAKCQFIRTAKPKSK